MQLRALSALLPLLACAPLPGPGADDDTGTSTGTSTGDASTALPDPTTGDPPTTGTGSSSGGGPTCGDGRIDPGEVCDGAALDDRTCADIDPNFVGGELACAADCGGWDVAGCDEGAPAAALNEVTSKGVAEGPYAGMGDAIELVNAGTAALDLTGWRVSVDDLFLPDATYVFPDGALAPGEFRVIVRLAEPAMPDGFPFEIAGDEFTLVLGDPDGAVVDEVTFAVSDAAASYCRLPDGTGDWQPCTPTFGAANAASGVVCGDGELDDGEQCDGADLNGQTCEGLGHGGGALTCTDACTWDDAQCVGDVTVALNELESVDDRIELHNAGDAPVDLAGWVLTDDVVDANYDPDADLEKLVFPAATELGPGEFLVVPKGMRPGQHPFGLSAGGDAVSLLRPNLALADQVVYGADAAAVSYCRLPDGPDGAWTAGCTPTFGAPNEAP